MLGKAIVLLAVTFGAASSVAAYEYRLAQGTSSYGRLEVRPTSSSVWGTVCDDLFGANDAIVACRSLGLSTTFAAYRSATSAEAAWLGSTTPIYFDDLGCSGSESRLDVCSRASSPNCVHGEDIVLFCGAPSASSTVPPLSSSSFTYRLQGGQAGLYGRLEVRPSNDSEWGTVCDDLFDSSDATVACRSLGLPTAYARYRTVSTTEAVYIASTVPTYFDDLACTGSEAELSQCSRASSENCNRYEDIVLSCSSVNAYTTPPSLYPPATGFAYRLVGGGTDYGRLEVRTTTDGEWGTVCDDSFTGSAAVVACRSLDLPVTPSAFATAGSQQGGSSSTPINLDDVVCSGSEASLAQCVFTTQHNCDHAEDVLIACGRDTIPTVTPGTSTVTPSPTESTTYSYRLYGGDAPNTGRLEVRPPNSLQWGTVCDDGFGSTDAIVACRSLGLPTSPSSFATAGSLRGGSSSQPIYFDDVACTGSESRLDQCRRSSTHNCIHAEDVLLTCGTYQATVQGTVRIAGDAFGELIASSVAALTAAVQADLASAVDVPAGNVTVDSLAVGSLIVNFTVRVASASAAALTAVAINAFAGRSSSSAFFPATQTLYSQQTSSGRAGQTLSVQSASAASSSQVQGSSPSSTSPPRTASPCGSGCIAGVALGIVGGIAVIAGLVALILFARNRNQRRGPENLTIQAFGRDGRPPVNAVDVEMRPNLPPTAATAAATAPFGGVYDGRPGGAPALGYVARPAPQYPPYPQHNHHNGGGGYPFVATPAYPAYPAYPQPPGAAWYDPQQQQQPQDVLPYGSAAYNSQPVGVPPTAVSADPDAKESSSMSCSAAPLPPTAGGGGQAGVFDAPPAANGGPPTYYAGYAPAQPQYPQWAASNRAHSPTVPQNTTTTTNTNTNTNSASPYPGNRV